MRVGVIDYGASNLGSVIGALRELQTTPILISKPKDMQSIDKFILPGVGNFSDCAKSLNDSGWIEELQNQVLIKSKPLLGICLGMQLLATSSTEGITENAAEVVNGLNFIPGRVESLRSLGCSLCIPHVGWNNVRTSNNSSNDLFYDIPNDTDFYFVHSYAFVPDDPMHQIATTLYDLPITAAISSGHIWGVQFHPEKSSRAGFKLLRNFIENLSC